MLQSNYSLFLLRSSQSSEVNSRVGRGPTPLAPSSLHFQVCAYFLVYEVISNKCCDNSVSTADTELKFCVSKHLLKMCLETKFQPFPLRNDRDIEGAT